MTLNTIFSVNLRQKHVDTRRPYHNTSRNAILNVNHLFFIYVKNNLIWTLWHHLAFTKHLGPVEASEASTRRPTTISSGRIGRPTQSSGVSVHCNQPDLGRWWKAGNTSSKIQGGGGESSIIDCNSWVDVLGFWRANLHVL